MVKKSLLIFLMFLAVVTINGCYQNNRGNDGVIPTIPLPSSTTSPSPLNKVTETPEKTKKPSKTPAIPQISLTPTFQDIYQIFSESARPIFSYTVVNTYPHDRTAFTQGLVYQDGVLIESTGRYQLSSLRKVDLISGSILQNYELPSTVFGEGITCYQDKLYQLTWKAGTGFIYDAESLSLLNEFHYSTEGWGITSNDEHLIMSNGSSELIILDADTLTEIDRLSIHDQGKPISFINELEYVDGYILANIWKSDLVVEIDLESGQITRWIDLSGLLLPEDMSIPVDVLNGIACNPENGNLFVTGKLWPKLFEIKLIEKE